MKRYFMQQFDAKPAQKTQQKCDLRVECARLNELFLQVILCRLRRLSLGWLAIGR